MDRPCILVVDDEPTVVEVVERYLKRDGYAVITASDGPSALESARTNRPHLIVLDVMLPGLDGLEVCRRLRETSKTPVIMVTARGDETDRIAGLDLGADDYIGKPFSPRELVSRVRAVLRRSYDENDMKPRDRVETGDLVIDPRGRSVTVAGERAELTAREFDLLWFLVTHPGEVFSREQLLERVWEYEWFGDASTVTVHVRRLRTKVEKDPDSPVHIRTVWGAGYKWES